MEIHQPFGTPHSCIWTRGIVGCLLRYRKVHILPPHKPTKPMHCTGNLYRFHPWVVLDLCVSASLVLQQDHTSRWYNGKHVSQPVPPVQLHGSWASCMVGSCVLPKFQTWSSPAPRQQAQILHPCSSGGYLMCRTRDSRDANTKRIWSAKRFIALIWSPDYTSINRYNIKWTTVCHWIKSKLATVS